MSDNTLLKNLAALTEPDNFQKYILGTKGNGQPRAIYDIVKDCTKPEKKKKKHKKNPRPDDVYQLFLTSKKKKKKKKKHKKNDYWHI